jgi:hypothetical protein
MSNRGRKLPRPKPKKEKKKKEKWSFPIVAVVLGMATILGGVPAVATFWPRISVTISDPVDLDNAFSALVTVSNTGNIPLDSVSMQMGVGDICTQFAPCTAPDFPDPRRDYITRFNRKQLLPHGLMKIDEHFTVALDDIAGAEEGKLVYADIAVIVKYKIPFIYFPLEKTYPLYTRRASNGKIYWQWK